MRQLNSLPHSNQKWELILELNNSINSIWLDAQEGIKSKCLPNDTYSAYNFALKKSAEIALIK